MRIRSRGIIVWLLWKRVYRPLPNNGRVSLLDYLGFQPTYHGYMIISLRNDNSCCST
jgi:hypothetical protein